jgi:hypothetical protein
MAKGKWGESFLKSGLPLEHLTLVTFKSLGWVCSTDIEYSRYNRDKAQSWFQLDLEAECTLANNDTTLSFLVECKYHDLSRFWFFLPHGADRWNFNDRVLNCAPYQTLVEPRSRSMLDLAPTSIWGIVVSEDGTKQDNAVHTAMQQIVNGYVPRSLSGMFGYNIDYRIVREEYIADFLPRVTAFVPMVVTNARIFRLKPEITDLGAIREALSPEDIADELEWTWSYHDVSMSLLERNWDLIYTHMEEEAEIIYHFPLITERLNSFADRPNWVAIVNIKSLAKAVGNITQHFQSLPTLKVEDVLKRMLQGKSDQES